MPGPFSVAVVEADDGVVTVMELVVVQDENMYWLLAMADIAIGLAASTQFVPDGVVAPVPGGSELKVIWY